VVAGRVFYEISERGRFLLRSLAHLLLPVSCLGCGQVLYWHEQHICLSCRHQLLPTLWGKGDEAPLSKRLRSLLPIRTVYAPYFFVGPMRHIIHQIKYGGHPMAAEHLGAEIAKGLKTLWRPDEYPDAVVPVPLHPKKHRIRGYNQSFLLAKGVGRSLGRPAKNWLVRTIHTPSQTTMSAAGRWDNVQNAFQSRRLPRRIRHILLVDDVITTGATTVACGRALLRRHPNLRLSIAALAVPWQ